MFKKSLFAGIGLVLLASPALAFAQSADVQSQIASLLAQIKQLQALIAQLQNGSQQTSCIDLNNTLTLGSKDTPAGYDVSRLQKYLIKKGYLDADSATGYFAFITAQAVGKMQIALSLVSSESDPAYGFAGPKTRAAIACNSAVSVQKKDVPYAATEKVTLSATPTSGAAPLVASFHTNSFAGATGSHDISFGDGSSSTLYPLCSASDPLNCSLKEITHTYASPGTYVVTLCAFGDTGSNCRAIATTTLTVTPTSSSPPIVTTVAPSLVVTSVSDSSVNATYANIPLANTPDTYAFVFMAVNDTSTWYHAQASVSGSSGSVSIPIPADLYAGTYRLRIFNQRVGGVVSGSVAESATFSISGRPSGGPSCTISQSASPYAQTASLTWTSSNATRAILKYPSGGGQVEVSPNATQLVSVSGTYSLEVYGTTGTGSYCVVNATISAPAPQPQPSPAGSATIDQSSLNPSSGSFMLSGTATGVTRLYIYVVPSSYSGATDLNSVSALNGTSGVFSNSTYLSSGGMWYFSLGGLSAGTYKVLVYDYSSTNVTLLATGTLVVPATQTTPPASTNAIDTNSLTASTGNPTITGSATVSPVSVLIYTPQGAYTSGPVYTSGNRWTHTFSQTTPIPNGQYEITLYNYSTGVQLDTHTLTVSH